MGEELTDIVAGSTGAGYPAGKDNGYLISDPGGSRGYMGGLSSLTGSYDPLSNDTFYRSLHGIADRYIVQPANELFPRAAIYDINRRMRMYKRRGKYNDGKEERELDM